MKVIREHACLKKITEDDDCYVNIPAPALVGFMWELTEELWSLQGKEYVERRLQRNVANLVKK